MQALLKAHGAVYWTVVTAHNPFGTKTDDTENQARQSSLQDVVRSLGHAHLQATGVGMGGWADEPSICIFNLTRDQAIGLGKLLEQDAVLFGSYKTDPEILVC
jgi:hypothetical protein